MTNVFYHPTPQNDLLSPLEIFNHEQYGKGKSPGEDLKWLSYEKHNRNFDSELSTHKYAYTNNLEQF